MSIPWDKLPKDDNCEICGKEAPSLALLPLSKKDDRRACGACGLEYSSYRQSLLWKAFGIKEEDK